MKTTILITLKPKKTMSIQRQCGQIDEIKCLLSIHSYKTDTRVNEKNGILAQMVGNLLEELECDDFAVLTEHFRQVIR